MQLQRSFPAVHASTRKTCARAPIAIKTRLLANEELEGHVLISWRSPARAQASMAAPAFLVNYSSLDTVRVARDIYCGHKGIKLMETLVPL